MSDNGAAAEEFFYYNENYGPFLRENYSDGNMLILGKSRNSYIAYGRNGKRQEVLPSNITKASRLEGGNELCRLIMQAPGLANQESINESFFYFTGSCTYFL